MGKMQGYFSDFLTNRTLFSNQFGLAGDNLADMAALLKTVVNLDTPAEFEHLFRQIDKKENIGDDITHKIHLYLNKIIFTPLDRSDIHALASGIDEIADAIREAAGRMFLYNIDEFLQPIKQLAVIILNACIEIKNAVAVLFTKKPVGLALISRSVKTHARQAGVIYDSALASLFSDEKNPIRLLKYREILSSLANAVNQCKNVSDIINTIMIGRQSNYDFKNAPRTWRLSGAGPNLEA